MLLLRTERLLLLLLHARITRIKYTYTHETFETYVPYNAAAATISATAVLLSDKLIVRAIFVAILLAISVVGPRCLN